MSRHAAIEIDFGNGTYTFRLGLAELEELERKRDVDVFSLARRLAPEQRAARSGDIFETIRLGLIGGGTKPVDALNLVRRYVDERPLDENRDVAYAVVLAALTRVKGGELQAPGEADAAKTMNASTSPQS